jgi:hypothetical protein
VIEQVVRNWHAYLRGELEGGLDELLHDEVVFYSPIVFTPQVGKEVTKLYLTAAAQTFPGDGATAPSDGGAAGSGASGAFRYTKHVLSGNVAVLEFETTIEGKYVNGIDIITCNDEGRIVEFRVMIRPLQAVNVVHRQMRAMLERLGGPGST